MDEITAVMAALLDTWQRRDAQGYLALLAEDVEVVNRGGQRLSGRAEFAAQLDKLLDRGFPEIFAAEHTIESIRRPAPGVAIVSELRAESQRRSRAVHLLVEHAGRWLVESIAIVPITPARLG